jgi:hypothetical protein
MSKVVFQHCIVPCVENPVVCWHVAHGWIWNVWEVSRQRNIGVFYATLLCGDGVVIHFDVLPGIQLHPATVLSAFRRGVALAAANADVVFATVQADNVKLIRCLCRLGFVVCRDASFCRDGAEIALLKYLPRAKC